MKTVVFCQATWYDKGQMKRREHASAGNISGGYGHEQSEILHRIGRSPAGGIHKGGGGPPDAPGGRGGYRGRGSPDGGHQPQRVLQVQGRGAALPGHEGRPHHHVLRPAEG